MADPEHLEALTAKLEQADAILAYTGGTARRIAAVRAILRPFRAHDMPTKATRALWVQVVETMLNLGVATAADCNGLSSKIRQLRNALRKHRALVLHP